MFSTCNKQKNSKNKNKNTPSAAVRRWSMQPVKHEEDDLIIRMALWLSDYDARKVAQSNALAASSGVDADVVVAPATNYKQRLAKRRKLGKKRKAQTLLYASVIRAEMSLFTIIE